MSDELLIEPRDLGGGWVEAYYQELETFRGMAIGKNVPPVRAGLYELAAHGLRHISSREQRKRAPMYKGGFIFYIPCTARDANYLLVRALKKVGEEMEPGWVSAVKDAQGTIEDPDSVAFWTRVPVEVVLALMES